MARNWWRSPARTGAALNWKPAARIKRDPEEIRAAAELKYGYAEPGQPKKVIFDKEKYKIERTDAFLRNKWFFLRRILETSGIALMFISVFSILFNINKAL